MKLSYIIPHKNRTVLFRENLKTLAAQTCKEFEIIIVDNSDCDDRAKLRRLVTEFRSAGLAIKVVVIDPSTHKDAHHRSEYGGNYNPAISQNIGVRKAIGDIICLTSPEVINAKTNCERAIRLFADGASRFVLGWIDERRQESTPTHLEGISVEEIKSMCSIPNTHGAMCRADVPTRPWLPINYFLGYMRRNDFIKIGGVDERFMRAIAYEDNFFAHCCEAAGFPAQINTDIAGIHLSHPRGYQSSLINSNLNLWNALKTTERSANSGMEWGSISHILEEW